MVLSLQFHFTSFVTREQDTPMEDQPHWATHVGLPNEASRNHHWAERDKGMPKVLKCDERRAREVRKWVYPNQRVTKAERFWNSNPKRSKKRKSDESDGVAKKARLSSE